MKLYYVKYMYMLLGLSMIQCYSGYKILKFGGSSLKSHKEIKNVAKIIIDSYKKEENPIVVCSACGDSTNKLLNLKRKTDFDEFKKYLTLLLYRNDIF